MKATNEHIDEKDQIQLAKKDKKHFAPIYEMHYKRIFSFIYRKLNEEAATADLTSQVFLKALLHLHKWKFEGPPFSSWLYRIAINECHEYFRYSNKMHYVVINEEAINNIADDINQSEEIEIRLSLTENALHQLKKHEVELIELRYYEKLQFKDIAYLLDISESNAKVKVYRILQKLKNIMMYEEF